MKFRVPGTEDPTLDGLPLARSGLYLSCTYPASNSAMTAAKSRQRLDARTTRDALMVAYGERVLNGLAPTASGRVYELYFPEEVHGAGLRLFDLVAQAALPELLHAKARSRKEATSETSSSPLLDALASSRDTSFLQTLRQLFETLHDGTHPLRIALEKLSTLDTVRIIEGKA